MAEDAGILERAMKAVTDSYGSASQWAGEISSFASRADDEAERRFPNQARDESVKNAYRHALGTGRLAQLLGAGEGSHPAVNAFADIASRGAGYVWEGMAAKRNAENPADMLHDLNANAMGADLAGKTNGFAGLADALERRAGMAVKEDPPSFFEPARKNLTYAK